MLRVVGYTFLAHIYRAFGCESMNHAVHLARSPYIILAVRMYPEIQDCPFFPQLRQALSSSGLNIDASIRKPCSPSSYGFYHPWMSNALACDQVHFTLQIFVRFYPSFTRYFFLQAQSETFLYVCSRWRPHQQAWSQDIYFLQGACLRFIQAPAWEANEGRQGACLRCVFPCILSENVYRVLCDVFFLVPIYHTHHTLSFMLLFPERLCNYARAKSK